MKLINDIVQYYIINGEYVLNQCIRHFLISIYGVLFATIIAIPVGLFISRNEKYAKYVIGIANVFQTIPQLAMLSLAMLLFGLGTNTVVITVTLYSLLPIIKNTYTGLKSVDSNVLDAAKGMGMTELQIQLKVELPLALPIIIAGVRNAVVVGIGITTIGTFIGAGGLGDIITRGINVANGSAIIMAGVIPASLMAIIIDLAISRLEKHLEVSH